jgi:Bacterial regulatory proteins, lacI family
VKRPTIRDVAAHAGISHQTVSRVINANGLVATETRERVLQAIRDLEYVPSAPARGLSSDRTHILGMVGVDVSDYFFAQAVAVAGGGCPQAWPVPRDRQHRGGGRWRRTSHLRLMLERRAWANGSATASAHGRRSSRQPAARSAASA